MLVKLADHFPNFRGENEMYLKPPPSKDYTWATLGPCWPVGYTSKHDEVWTTKLKNANYNSYDRSMGRKVHLPTFTMKKINYTNVGKYTIHGSYGIEMD